MKKFPIGVNIYWAVCGLKTVVRPHVASLLVNARNLDSEFYIPDVVRSKRLAK